MLILSLTSHPLSLVQQGAEEVGSGTERPVPRDVTQERTLGLDSHHALDLGQVTLSD